MSITENRDNSYLWKHIKSLTGQTEESILPQELIVDDITSNYPQDVAEKLNSCFANISERIKVGQPSQETFKTNLNEIISYIHSLIPDDVNFKNPLMKPTDLVTSMKSLDTTKATGIHGITPSVIKSSADVIAPSLLHIINTSIQSGQFPDLLKIAKFKPLLKSGSKSDPLNYRPVSILSVV